MKTTAITSTYRNEEIRSIIQMHKSNTITIKGTVKERIEQVKSAITQYV